MINDLNPFDFYHYRENLESDQEAYRSAFESVYLDNFRQAVHASEGKIKRKVPKETKLFRARKGCNYGGEFGVEKLPFIESEIVPPTKHKSWGRFNVPGHPVLYLAASPEVAAAEVQPNHDEEVSVGRFILNTDVTLADFSHLGSPEYLRLMELEAISIEEKHNYLIQKVGQAFSQPVNSELAATHYRATQKLGYLLNAMGYDGIAYKSAFWGPG